MNIDKLKNKILQLAIQGKLVEQDKNDESAEVLYEKIQEEKEQLIKEKKIRRVKVDDVEESDIPFEIPNSWKWVRLNSISDVRDGTHDTPKYHEEGIPLVTSKNISNGYINLEDTNKISLEDHNKISERSKVDKGDILFAMIGSIGNPVLVDIDSKFSIKNVALFKFYNNESIDNRYLYYFLLKMQSEMKDNAAGGVQKFVSLTVLRNYLTPLPPLNEQKRIVEKVDELFKIIDKLNNEKEDILELINRTRESILTQAIQGKLVEQDKKDESAEVLYEKIQEEKEQLIKKKKIRRVKVDDIEESDIPFEIPNSWKWVRLSELSNNIHYGYTASSQDEDTGVKMLRITDIQNDRVIWENVPYCIIEKSKINNYKLKSEDILIARTGGTIGKTFIVEENEYTSVFASYLIRVELNRGTNAYYVNHFLKSELYLEQLYSKSKGTGQPNVNATSLSNILIPLPPLNEQKRIVEKTNKLMNYLDEIENIIQN